MSTYSMWNEHISSLSSNFLRRLDPADLESPPNHSTTPLAYMPNEREYMILPLGRRFGNSAERRPSFGSFV